MGRKLHDPCAVRIDILVVAVPERRSNRPLGSPGVWRLRLGYCPGWYPVLVCISQPQGATVGQCGAGVELGRRGRMRTVHLPSTNLQISFGRRWLGAASGMPSLAR